MGTYTTNYNLFMPSIGEQGWGTLVNGNFATIDAMMAGLNTRVGTLETETGAMKGKLDYIEINNGAVEGNFTGNFTGVLTGKINVQEYSTSGDIKLFDLSFNNPSIANTTVSNALTCNIATVTPRTSNVFTYVGDTPVLNSTCTISGSIKQTGTYVNGSTGSTLNPKLNNGSGVNVTVVDTTTGSTVLNTKISTTFTESYKILGTGNSVSLSSTSFMRNSAHSYTINLSSAISSSQAWLFNYSVSTNTPVATAYITL